MKLRMITKLRISIKNLLLLLFSLLPLLPRSNINLLNSQSNDLLRLLFSLLLLLPCSNIDLLNSQSNDLLRLLSLLLLLLSCSNTALLNNQSNDLLLLLRLLRLLHLLQNQIFHLESAMKLHTHVKLIVGKFRLHVIKIESNFQNNKFQCNC